MMAGELKAILAKGEFIVAPGVFEMLSAKIADGMGFKALYMTGYGISASHLASPTRAWSPTATWSSARAPSRRARKRR